MSKAEPGDAYGDVQVSVEASLKDYDETLRYAYTGDLHKAAHAEVKIDWDNLPEPASQAGGH